MVLAVVTLYMNMMRSCLITKVQMKLVYCNFRLWCKMYLLTLGPGGPTFPADPGNPVGPYDRKGRLTDIVTFLIQF